MHSRVRSSLLNIMVIINMIVLVMMIMMAVMVTVITTFNNEEHIVDYNVIAVLDTLLILMMFPYSNVTNTIGFLVFNFRI